MQDHDQPATKKDLADLGKQIVEEIGEQLQDAMTLISARFDGVEQRLDD